MGIAGDAPFTIPNAMCFGALPQQLLQLLPLET